MVYCSCMAMFYSYRKYGNIYFNYKIMNNDKEIKQSYMPSSDITMVSGNIYIYCIKMLENPKELS